MAAIKHHASAMLLIFFVTAGTSHQQTPHFNALVRYQNSMLTSPDQSPTTCVPLDHSCGGWARFDGDS